MAKGGHGSGPHGGGIRPAEPDRPPRDATYDLFGLSPDFLRKLSIEPPLVDRIFLANVRFFLHPFDLQLAFSKKT